MTTNSKFLQPDVLIQYCLMHTPEVQEGLDPYIEEILRSELLAFINQEKTLSEVNSIFLEKIMTDTPVQIANDIMNVNDTPAEGPFESEEPSDENVVRKKSHTWTMYEDRRLIAGIFRFGSDNWIRVAKFVGGGRTRAQCAQRWTRGLNPRICKRSWTVEEDAQLLSYARIYGTKSWAKIANLMGNRSDVQCRYHYTQLISDVTQNEGFIPLGKNVKQITASGFIPTGLVHTLFPSPNVVVSSLTQFPLHLLNKEKKTLQILPPGMQQGMVHDGIHCWDFEKNEKGSLDLFLKQIKSVHHH